MEVRQNLTKVRHIGKVISDMGLLPGTWAKTPANWGLLNKSIRRGSDKRWLRTPHTYLLTYLCASITFLKILTDFEHNDGDGTLVKVSDHEIKHGRSGFLRWTRATRTQQWKSPLLQAWIISLKRITKKPFFRDDLSLECLDFPSCEICSRGSWDDVECLSSIVGVFKSQQALLRMILKGERLSGMGWRTKKSVKLLRADLIALPPRVFTTSILRPSTFLEHPLRYNLFSSTPSASSKLGKSSIEHSTNWTNLVYDMIF